MITTTHERWSEFYGRLAAAVGDPASSGCTDSMDRPMARRALAAMGFSEREIGSSLDYFEQHGGYCDCEILLNVGAEEIDHQPMPV